MQVLLRILRCSLAALILSTGLAAYKSGPQAYDVVVSLNRNSFPAGMIPSMEVDIVPVTDIELNRDGWDSFSVNNYFRLDADEWKIREQFYNTEKSVKFQFSEDKSGPCTLSEGDPFWEKRLAAGVKHLVIIANIPGSGFKDSPGQDPRRLVLPLDSARWGGRKIEVQLTKINIDLITPMVVQE